MINAYGRALNSSGRVGGSRDTHILPSAGAGHKFLLKLLTGKWTCVYKRVSLEGREYARLRPQPNRRCIRSRHLSLCLSVREARFLCGEDALTGRSFDHRKDWIRDRLEELAGDFAIDVLGSAVLSNHLHVMLAFGPMLPVGSAIEEVARRWLRVFRWQRDDIDAPQGPDERAVAMLLRSTTRPALVSRTGRQPAGIYLTR